MNKVVNRLGGVITKKYKSNMWYNPQKRIFIYGICQVMQDNTKYNYIENGIMFLTVDRQQAINKVRKLNKQLKTNKE